ncbi:MAG: hypothetical protein LCH37_15255 [Bacteroidetes bacterium]|nr:hypothetical protein [Bacteroidota bacterium]
MNCIYKSDTVTIHDDRTPLTIDQAIDILWNGGAVRQCYPTNYSEDEPEFDQGYIVDVLDILTRKQLEDSSKSRETKQRMMLEAMRGYEYYES